LARFLRRSGAMNRMQRILCPTDFSDYASRALDYSIELARSFGSGIWLVHVLEPPVLFGAELSSSSLLNQVIKLQHERAEAELVRASERCRAMDVQAVMQLEIGYPANVIVELSKNADLIVIGTHGRTGFQRLALGSVAERVVRMGKCPVLVVPNPRDAKHQAA
jgi:nucleotide-binding universal stress UspA family protein